MKKLLGLLLASIVILAGCGSDTVDLEHEGDGVLTIWGFYEGAPKVAADYFAEQSGIEVDYQTIGYDDYQTKLNTVLGTDDAPDMLMLERGFMGSYLASENIISLDALLEGDEQFDAYKTNTALATAGPGIVNDEVKAIGWENTASAFFYRSDLAETCLGITSVEEMEEATSTVESYLDLAEELKSSDNADCNSMTLLSYPDFYKGLYSNAGAYKVDGTDYTISSEFGEALDSFKYLVDNNIIYSPDADKPQITAGAQKDAFLGTIAPAWGTQAVLEYEQPGLWSVADTPLDYTDGGTFLAVTPNADMEIVTQFLDSTFLSEEWLVNNMDTFGMVGNETVMNKYLESTSGENEYFGGQNTVAKFAEINDQIESYDPVTVYDAGIRTSVEEVSNEYAINGTYSSLEEAEQALSDKITGLYPDVTVTIE